MRLNHVSCTQTMSNKAIILLTILTNNRTATTTTAIRNLMAIHTTLHPTRVPRRPPRSLSTSSASLPLPSRTTSSWSETPRAVNTRISYSWSHYAQSGFLSQVRPARTHPSRSSGMAHSVRSGYAIGMGRYPPIHRYPPCNVVPGQDQSTQIGGWSQ